MVLVSAYGATLDTWGQVVHNFTIIDIVGIALTFSANELSHLKHQPTRCDNPVENLEEQVHWPLTRRAYHLPPPRVGRGDRAQRLWGLNAPAMTRG